MSTGLQNMVYKPNVQDSLLISNSDGAEVQLNPSGVVGESFTTFSRKDKTNNEMKNIMKSYIPELRVSASEYSDELLNSGMESSDTVKRINRNIEEMMSSSGMKFKF